MSSSSPLASFQAESLTAALSHRRIRRYFYSSDFRRPLLTLRSRSCVRARSMCSATRGISQTIRRARNEERPVSPARCDYFRFARMGERRGCARARLCHHVLLAVVSLSIVPFARSLTRFWFYRMMPNFYALLDRVDHFLCPTGLLSVCDFYVSAREKTSLSEIIGDVASRHCSWLTRMFWLHWSVSRVASAPTYG